jgi:hypothetical protein
MTSCCSRGERPTYRRQRIKKEARTKASSGIENGAEDPARQTRFCPGIRATVRKRLTCIPVSTGHRLRGRGKVSWKCLFSFFFVRERGVIYGG